MLVHGSAQFVLQVAEKVKLSLAALCVGQVSVVSQ